ncbi:ACP S-malonyltransferase [Streptomyces sp. VB1]|uniref:ACP S-malonyltransferase n=1 Tax=Streptomyces sp. VB1 TaxID=2986803 RepID=UPI002241D267|nr:ACP S-malonyltransferase [Streptomyces sp. VB1]UZI27455.1 ACP S-malonyltransferase [Streptomyces sp. VB1]
MSQLPIGLVFPGQGTQRQGMGEQWRETPSWELTEEISEATGEDLAELLLHTSTDQLRRTDLAQLTVFSVAVVAHAEAVRRGALGTTVVACAGHSLGEYAALTAAGALTVSAAAALVAARGRAMRDAAEQRAGTMGVLVAAPLPEVDDLVAAVRASGPEVWVANVNAPGQTVVSGSPEGVALVEEYAPSIGGKMIRLQAGGAFHSPYMAPAVAPLRRALKDTAFAPAHLPVVANVDAEPYGGDGDWTELGVRQLTSPVLWERSVRTLTGVLGCRKLVELGPGRTLAGLIKRIDPEVEVVSLNGPDALEPVRDVAVAA